MSATTVRIKKEARALFWPWCGMMAAGLLAVAPAIPHGLAEGARVLVLFVGIPLLAALTFGNEFTHHTFALLLVQPVDRSRIWREKLLVSAGAAISIGLVMGFALRSDIGLSDEWLGAIIILSLTASMPFWTLLSGSTLGGIALGALTMFGANLAFAAYVRFSGISPASLPVWTGVALAYAIAMLWLSHRRLTHLQTSGGLAGHDVLLSLPNILPENLAGRFRATDPVFNLIRKEFRMLRALWVMAVLVAAYLACVAALGLLPDPALTHESPLKVGLIVPVVAICGLIAILAGCVSLGEERTSGTHAWHLTLPVTAGRLWLIKLLVALFTSLVCAVVLPDSILLAGGFFAGAPLKFVDPIATLMWMFAVSLMTLTSFWCACVVNGTLRAALWTFPVIIGSAMALQAGEALGRRLVETTGSLRAYIIATLETYPGAFTPHFDVSPYILLAVVLLALRRGYRLFRRPGQDSAVSLLRNLAPFVSMWFAFSFLWTASFAGWNGWEAFSEIQASTEKLVQRNQAHFTGEDLAKASPLSRSSARWVRNATVSVTPRPTRPGYIATIHWPSGLECRLVIDHIAGRPVFVGGYPGCRQP